MKIISRREWGAAPPTSLPSVSVWPKGVTLWLHHTAGPPTQTPREIQAFHQKTRGWQDVGYNYLIDEAGTVYEGRGRDVRGAHSPPKNHEPSVALIGTYTDKQPTDAQHRAVYALRAYLSAGRIRGHRDSWGTTCPGDAAYSKIITAGPPAAPAPVAVEPDWRTLRVVIRPEGKEARQWSGRKARGAVVWIAKNGVAANADAAIAYGGNVWRGPRDVTNVATNLTRRFFS